MVLGFWEGSGRDPSRARPFTKNHRLERLLWPSRPGLYANFREQIRIRFQNPFGGGPRSIRLSIFSEEFLFVNRLSNHQVIPASTYDDTFSASFFRSELEVQPMFTMSKPAKSALRCLINVRMSLMSSGLGSLSGRTRGTTPSHWAARSYGPRLGQKPATQIGIRGF
jgi:hypothetical protein